VFDIITELSKMNNQFHLIFKRVLWYSPLRLDSEYYVDMIYNQVLPDYVDGMLLQFDVPSLVQDNNKLLVLN
jgi:myosin-15